MRVEDIMVRKEITVSRLEPIANAARKMREAKVGCLVIAKRRKVEGVVTDRDVFVSCIGAGHDPQQCQVIYHMSNPGITAEPSLDIADASRLMAQKSVGCLPVVVDDRLVGLVSFSDIVRALNEPTEDVPGSIGAAGPSESDGLSWLFDVKPEHMRPQ